MESEIIYIFRLIRAYKGLTNEAFQSVMCRPISSHLCSPEGAICKLCSEKNTHLYFRF